jgi:2,3-bisphosphoglycerate-dependent phosphoglycerate mutase
MAQRQATDQGPVPGGSSGSKADAQGHDWGSRFLAANPGMASPVYSSEPPEPSLLRGCRRTTAFATSSQACACSPCRTIGSARDTSRAANVRWVRRGTLTLLLVRHAEPEAALPGEPLGDERSLTPGGREQALRVARSLAGLEVKAVYSSPYRRAVETMAPIAQGRGLTVQIMDELRERRLTTQAMSEDERLRHSILSAQDGDYRAPGGESRREAAERGIAAISEIRRRHNQRLVVIGSHAGLIRIILSTFDSRADLEFGRTMPMPAVYRLTNDGVAWKPDLRLMFPKTETMHRSSLPPALFANVGVAEAQPLFIADEQADGV